MDFQLFGGGKSAVKLFQDTFVRPDTSAGLGSNWLGLTASLGVASPGHDSRWRIVSNKAHLQLSGGAGGSPAATIYAPWPIINASVFGKTQFSQCVVSQFTNGAGVQVGPCVACATDPFAETAVVYGALFNQSATQYLVFLKLTPDLFTNQVLLTGNKACAVGDILRISVQFNTPDATKNTIIVTRNGIVEVNVTDNSANRPILAGFPGLYGWVGNGPGNADVSSFSCGLGL